MGTVVLPAATKPSPRRLARRVAHSLPKMQTHYARTKRESDLTSLLCCSKSNDDVRYGAKRSVPLDLN
jgi:hypothetical protein